MDIPNNRINIGRGHISNILLNDISVSRLHCYLNINKNNKKIFISDNNSKFGTLILVQSKSIIMSSGLNLHIQIGRSYLKMLLKKQTSIFSCCGVNEKKNSDFYYLQNKDKEKYVNKLTVKTENETTESLEEKDEIGEIKEERNEIDLMKTKVNLMDDNDLEGLLLTKPFETNINNKENDLIDEEEKNEKGSSIIINDNDDNDKSNNNIKYNLFSQDNNKNKIILDKNDKDEN